MTLDNYWVNAIWSIIPTIGIAGLFWFVIRSILRADRTERRARDRIEAQLRAERNQPRQPQEERERNRPAG